VPDRLEGRLRWLFGGVAVVLVASGIFALLEGAHAEPAQGGSDAAAPFVTALLAVAIVIAAALGALVVRSPRRFTHLMPVWALASGAAALAFLAVLVGLAKDDATFAPALGGLLAALTLMAASTFGWVRLWLAPRPGVATAARDAALLDALLRTMAPEGDGLTFGANDPAIRAAIVQSSAARSSGRKPVLRIALRVLDALALVKHRRRLVRLDAAAREALLGGLATSRLAALRTLGMTLDAVVLTLFYGDPRVREQIGDDPGRLATMIEDGPNGAAHRARREEAERAAVEVARAAIFEPERAPDVVGDEPVAPPLAAAPVVAAGALRAEEVPFDRPWRLGVPAESAGPELGASALRVARASGPTRP